ncbi:Uncharacterised protein [Acinetobacter baumannii]|nr:Uncharacterised protein [Acinetobacter baumannii]
MRLAVAGIAVAEEVQHHRAAPDHGDRVGDVFAENVRRRAVHRLEQRREIAFRVQVGRGGDADGAGAGRAEIRQNIAEQVGGDHHVEAFGVQHEARAQNIDVLFVPGDIRVLARHLRHALIPVRHADGHAIGLGGGGQAFARALLRQLKGVLEDAVHALTGEDRFLDHHLAFGAFEHPSAERGVFPFGIFAHHVEINIARLLVRQRAGHAGKQPHRTQVDVLFEVAPEFQQRTPQRDMIGHRVRPTDGAEIDGVEAFQLLEPVVRHHLAVVLVVVAAGPLEGGEFQRQIPARRRRLQYSYAFRQHFPPDTVPGDGGNLVRFAHTEVSFVGRGD